MPYENNVVSFTMSPAQMNRACLSDLSKITQDYRQLIRNRKLSMMSPAISGVTHAVWIEGILVLVDKQLKEVQQMQERLAYWESHRTSIVEGTMACADRLSASLAETAKLLEKLKSDLTEDEAPPVAPTAPAETPVTVHPAIKAVRVVAIVGVSALALYGLKKLFS